MIDTAKRLEQLPDTEAAVTEGRLSARQAQLVAEAAAHNPGVERELLAAAGEGMVPLKDASSRVPARKTKRLAPLASAPAAGCVYGPRTTAWSKGHFRLAPEVGGRLKAAIDARTQRIFRSRRASGPHEALEAYAADALTDIVLGNPGTAKAPITNVHVMLDHTALVRGYAIEGETCEIPGVGPVNVAWVRRCSAKRSSPR